MTELLSALCCLNGAPGDEDEVRDFIRACAAPYADSIHTDPLGNLIVFKKGKRATGHSFLMAAHMDEVGVIVTSITDEGYLKFRFLGGVDRRVVLGKRVLLGANRVPGVIGIKAVHLTDRDEREKIPKEEALYIDVGANSKQQAQRLAGPGTYGCFDVQPERFGDGMLKAKALDDRAGCAVMLELLKEELPLDVSFVFTAQEEVGSRGALGAGYSAAPRIALVLEATTAADQGESEAHKQVCVPGRGPVLLHMDSGAIYDRGLFQELRRIAEDYHIPWQCKEYISGGNDAGAFQRTRAGVRVAAVAAAVRCLHAPSSVGKISDFTHILRLTRLFLARAAEILSQEGNCHGAV